MVLDEDTDPVHGFAPGQTDVPNSGAPLDFVGVNNPQPIHGSKGGTEAGPREYFTCISLGMNFEG